MFRVDGERRGFALAMNSDMFHAVVFNLEFKVIVSFCVFWLIYYCQLDINSRLNFRNLYTMFDPNLQPLFNQILTVLICKVLWLELPINEL